MFSYCYYMQECSKNINSGMIITENRPLLNKIKYSAILNSLNVTKRIDRTKFKL